MGLWDWVWETITGRPPARESAPSPGDPWSTSSSVLALDLVDRPPPTSNRAKQVHPQGLEHWWTVEGVTQTDPIAPARPRMTLEVRALEERLISHFDGHDLVLPALPHVAEKVLTHLRSANASMGDVAHDLSEDPVSAADVLRMANCPLYRGVEKITSLQNAVARLGGGALRTLMMHQSIRSAILRKKGKRSDALAEWVWQGSLASAAIMRELGQLLHMDPEEAFLTGLLHDIGNVIVLRLVYQHENLTRSLIEPPTFHYLCYETHQEFGELIADAWQLPINLRSLVANHHAYPLDNDPLRRDRLMLVLSDMIGQMLGYLPSAQYDLLNVQAVKDLGLSGRTDFVDLLAHLPDKIDQTAAEFR